MIEKYWMESISELREFKIIGEIEDYEFESIKEDMGELMNNQFIQSSNEKGIQRWEKILNIQPFSDDTLEGRRFRVLARWSMQRPYSYRRLLEKLDNLVGKNGYIIWLNHEEYKIVVRINLGQKRMLDSVSELVRKTIPANMIMDIDLRYNRYGDVKEFDYGYFNGKTYFHMKEEVLG